MKERFVKQLHSFGYAFRGLLSVLKTESHMRFHLIAGLYVIGFCAKFYNLTSAQWGVLILTICAVFVTEIFNTVLERVCDTITTEYNKNVEFIKDVSAGAVLVTSIGAVIIAFFMLFQIEVFKYIVFYFSTHIFSLLVAIFITAFAIAFVVIKPETYLKKSKSDSKKSVAEIQNNSKKD